MIYIFGPYAAGKREYVRETFGYTEADFSTKAEDNCRVLYDAQQLASKVGNRPEELEKLAEQLCRKEVVIATETGCGVVPIDAAEREAREAADGCRFCLQNGRRKSFVSGAACRKAFDNRCLDRTSTGEVWQK